MALFRRKKDIEERDDGFRPDDPAADLARAFGLDGGVMTFEKAMQLPPVSASIDFISSICARVPIKLYRESGKGDEIRTEELKADKRIDLLNGSTGDSLNAYQMKKAWVTDYFGFGQGYIYIDKVFGAWRSLRYVEQDKIAINIGTHPIFKDADIFIADKKYFYWDFLRLCRNTVNGFKGKSIIDTNGELLTLMYKTMRFEKNLMNTGGNKKGFLKSETKLTEKAMQEIKSAWRNLYSTAENNNVMVLNNGLDYKDTSATSTELQLNENKLTNNDLLTMIFLLSAKALQGASDDDIVSAVKTAVIPIIEQMEQAFNEGLLLEEEKSTMYWACDTSALERGDILKRFQAYKLAIEGNFMQADEIRYKEDMPALGLNWIRLGLDDVLYDPKTKLIYTPNTNATVKMGESGELRYNSDQPRDEHGRFTFGSGGGNSSKAVDKSGKSGIIKETNQAKAIDIFNDYDVSDNSPIKTKQIVEELKKTEIGKQTLKDIENLPERIKLSYEYESSGICGEENGGAITIYLRNCKDAYWAARTVIHERTHWKYGIGNNQWAECVCIAQELKHARNRDTLTISEKRTIVKAVKDAYPEYKWKKGGTLYGRKKW